MSSSMSLLSGSSHHKKKQEGEEEEKEEKKRARKRRRKANTRNTESQVQGRERGNPIRAQGQVWWSQNWRKQRLKMMIGI